jgi:hypothetical protein
MHEAFDDYQTIAKKPGVTNYEKQQASRKFRERDHEASELERRSEELYYAIERTKNWHTDPSPYQKASST